ncbi:MAG: ABC transporter substrate-binding protein [Pseudomonadota bacterium]
MTIRKVLISLMVCAGFYSIPVLGQQYKIASAGGSITETIYALGRESVIVAVDSSSQYPASVTTLPQFGYFRQISPEGIISTGATHVFAAKGFGPESAVEQLSSLGMNVEIFDVPRTVPGLHTMIRQIGAKLDAATESEALIASIDKDIATIVKKSTQSRQTTVAFLMSVTDHGLRAAGQDTVPHLIFDTLELTNVFAEVNGFKSVSPETLVVTPPELIIIPSHQVEGLSTSDICSLQAMKLYASAKGCNVLIVDPLMFLGMTPRLADAMQIVLNELK